MLIIYQKKKIIESDWLGAMQVLLQTAQKQGFSGFSMVATINRFHYPVILTGKCFHVYIIFWRVNHNFSPSIWNSLALVCFFKKLKLQFWYFLKNNLGQMKKFQIDLEVTWYLDIHVTIWLFHLKMKSCFTLRILFISTAAIYLMLVRISSIQVSLQLNSLNSGRQCL